jgi:hypothetical protein
MNGGPEFAITPPGASEQTWDYATAFDIADVANLIWMSPTFFPVYEQFPDANLGLVGNNGPNFFRSASSGLYYSGVYEAEVPFTSISHQTDGLWMPTPFTYGSIRTLSNTYTGITVYQTGPAEMGVIHINGTFECDAWGTMSTPAYPSGTNVLRIKRTYESAVDSSFTDDTGTGNGPWVLTDVEFGSGGISYQFVRDAAPYPVMDSDTQGTQVSFYSDAGNIGMEDFENAPRVAVVYPVPSSDDMMHIALNNAAVSTVEISDASGRGLRTIGTRGADVLNIGTEGWAAGTYLFRCFARDGSMLDRGRFVIVH